METEETPTGSPPHGSPLPDSPLPEPGQAEPAPFDRSIRRQVLLILAFVTLSVLALTLAAGGVDAAGHAVTHLLAGPEGCGGG